MKLRPTYTIALESPSATLDPVLKRELNRLEIATNKTNQLSHNGCSIYSYTSPVEELVTLLELFWDMDEFEAEEFVLDYERNH